MQVTNKQEIVLSPSDIEDIVKQHLKNEGFDESAATICWDVSKGYSPAGPMDEYVAPHVKKMKIVIES